MNKTYKRLHCGKVSLRANFARESNVKSQQVQS